MVAVPVALVEVFSSQLYIPRANLSLASAQAAGGDSRDRPGPPHARRVTAGSAPSR